MTGPVLTSEDPPQLGILAPASNWFCLGAAMSGDEIYLPGSPASVW